MKKVLAIVCLLSFLSFFCLPAMAEEKTFDWDRVTSKTVAGGALSLLVWPGIGQAINDEKGEKVLTHAVIGIFPPFRFWSCYDALFDREGGYWKGRI